MPLRDLEYPDDAIKTIDSLAHALRYDASIAILGVRAQGLPESVDGPVGDVRVRASGKIEDSAVQRDAPVLLSRFALLQMLSRFEMHMGNLLLQRRVLEHLVPDKRMQPGDFWKILKSVDKESRSGPVKIAFGAVVVSPSNRLMEMKPWIEGLYAVRNCLAHRNGLVSLVDVAPSRRDLEQTNDSDTLIAKWVMVRLAVDGVPLELPFTHPGGDVGGVLETVERQWSVGEHIDLQPSEVQGICFALTMLGNEVLRCFQKEMNVLFGL